LIDFVRANSWTGVTTAGAAAEYYSDTVQEAAAAHTRPGGNPQHNWSTDPGLVLVATQDCHKVRQVNQQPPLYARYPIYKLRQPTDKTKAPTQFYTVFESIPQLSSRCNVNSSPAGYLNLNPCQYGVGTYNQFEDEISAGLSAGFNNTQYFLYGPPNQRLFGVKQIYRTLSDGSLTPKPNFNQLLALPQSDPLIDGHVDPWLAPWDGTAASCDSLGSRYFSN
jgi:hypothetical protein